MKIKNLKDFNSLLSSKNLCILSQKEENEMNNIHKINDSNNSISKNGLIDNNNDNISSVINSLNIRKSNLPEQKKDKKNNIQVNSTNLSLYIDKNDKQNNTIVINKNYIYRVGSLHQKNIIIKEKQKEENDIKKYTNKIDFNIFDYYCLRKISRKKKDIELFNLGLSLYKKRMDIINIFSFLLLSENKFLENEQ